MTSRESRPLEKLKKTIVNFRSVKRFTNAEELPKLPEQEEKEDKMDDFEIPLINVFREQEK